MTYKFDFYEVEMVVEVQKETFQHPQDARLVQIHLRRSWLKT